MTEGFGIDSINPKCVSSQWDFSFEVQKDGDWLSNEPFIAVIDPDSQVFGIETNDVKHAGIYTIELTASHMNGESVENPSDITERFKINVIPCKARFDDSFPVLVRYTVSDDPIITRDFEIASDNEGCETSMWDFSFKLQQNGK